MPDDSRRRINADLKMEFATSFCNTDSRRDGWRLSLRVSSCSKRYVLYRIFSEQQIEGPIERNMQTLFKTRQF